VNEQIRPRRDDNSDSRDSKIIELFDVADPNSITTSDSSDSLIVEVTDRAT
jgi:hypothetical protein